MKFQIKILLAVVTYLFFGISSAEEPVGQYSSLPYPSVADNISAMDKDHDGIITVHEVRDFLEAKRGKGYEKKAFDQMEKAADSRSCGSPFSQSFY